MKCCQGGGRRSRWLLLVPTIILVVVGISSIMIWKLIGPKEEPQQQKQQQQQNTQQQAFTDLKIPSFEDLFGSDGEDDGDSSSASNNFSATTYQFIQCNTTITNNNSSTTSTATELCCNGLSSNCSLKLSEAMFAMMHNAMSTKEDNYIRPNHELSLKKALQAGFRAFEFDICHCPSASSKSSNIASTFVDFIQQDEQEQQPSDTDNVETVELKFCHGFCFAGTSNIVEKMTEIVTFLQNYPSEIVVVDFQFGGSHDTPMIYVESLMNTILLRDVSGLKDLLYVFYPNEDNGYYNTAVWPAMGELVQSNKRLILFQHDGPDTTTNEYHVALHNMYWHTARNNYRYQSKQDLMNYTKSCSYMGRGHNGQFFYQLNHFITPDSISGSYSHAIQVNGRDELLYHINNCSQINNDIVNFVSIDYWSYSDLPEVVQTINQFRARTATTTIHEEEDGDITSSETESTTTTTTTAYKYGGSSRLLRH